MAQARAAREAASRGGMARGLRMARARGRTPLLGDRIVDLVVWTIGHSSQPIESFLALLGGHRIERVADVRRYPGSRAHPRFNPGPLAERLGDHGIEYVPLPELGGRRAPDPASTTAVWRNTAFRGYADYMQTPEFEAGLARLLQLASERRTAILCSEAVWWRCPRSLIADALKVRGVRVRHIMSGSKEVEHPYTSAAHTVDGRLLYGPAPAA